MGKVKILSEERILDSYIKIDKATVEHEMPNGEKTTYSRFKVDRPDAVVALVCNKSENTVILVRQFRYPVASNGYKENVLEAVAGKIDSGETPMQAVVRELEEEIGYIIPEHSLTFIGETFVSPGYTTEKFHLFIAQVDNTMKISEGGGLASEHEDIELVELHMDTFIGMLQNNEIKDAKTFMLAQALVLRKISADLSSVLLGL
jgi:nudix-type nucleoside diphosphatase (YffH/AdpP family)